MPPRPSSPRISYPRTDGRTRTLGRGWSDGVYAAVTDETSACPVGGENAPVWADGSESGSPTRWAVGRWSDRRDVSPRRAVSGPACGGADGRVVVWSVATGGPSASGLDMG